VKFGLQLPTFGPTANSELIMSCARQAEHLGFDSLWTNDHVLIPRHLVIPYETILECLVVLSAVAAITNRVRLGTSVLVLPQRNPVLLAKQLATLDVISNGRLICGLAAGYVSEEMTFLGAEFGHRGEAFEEYLAAMRHLWRHGGGTFHGRWVHFDEAVFAPRPVQGSALPIWIGGNGARAIARAANLADGWHPGALSPAEVAAGILTLRELAPARRVTVSVKLRVKFPWSTGFDAQRSPTEYSHQHDLVGDVDEVCRELEQYQAAGVEHFVAFFYHGDEAELSKSIRVFAEKVMPAFSDNKDGDVR
jgi:probable F420-dependent oxidoreductase